MSNRDTQIGREYEDLVLRRPEPLVPRGRTVDWGDQPSHFKIYNDVPRLPLHNGTDATLRPLGRLVVDAPLPHEGESQPLTYERLSSLLLLTNGLLGRRLDVNWNPENGNMLRHEGSTYARPAASGGGRYPCELYLVTGPQSGLPAGVYHYDNAHHAAARLTRGDHTQHVRAALLDHPAATADCFLLVSINFWKNHFKYHNFSYHVVTQDLGAMLGTVSQVAAGMGVAATVLHWFRDEALNQLLGLETTTESVFAVVALGPGVDVAKQDKAAQDNALALGAGRPAHRSYQRSKRVFNLPLVETVHQATLIDDEPRPTATEIARARCAAVSDTGEVVSLPAPQFELMQQELQQVLRARRSSSGRMLSQRPLDQVKLATLLSSIKTARAYNSDVQPAAPADDCTRLMVLVNHVEGVARGVYNYDAHSNALRLVQRGEFGAELQDKYFLQNYNTEQPAVVIAVVGSFEPMLEVFGNRGVRVLNTTTGVLTQQAYTAAASLVLGCGAILGYKNVEVNKLFGLEGSAQTALIMLLVGAEHGHKGGFDYSLV